jgi:hypothetical protein
MKRLLKMALVGVAVAGARKLATNRSRANPTVDARRPERAVRDMEQQADFPGGVRP